MNADAIKAAIILLVAGAVLFGLALLCLVKGAPAGMEDLPTIRHRALVGLGAGMLSLGLGFLAYGAAALENICERDKRRRRHY